MKKPERPWILGLTGGIASGKTAAANHFAQLGIHTVDADQAARWVVEPGTTGLAAIVSHFGASILLPNGQLDRGRLRQRIFDEPDQRRWLESLLHPLIANAVEVALAQADSPYAIMVSPLLIETGQYRKTQRVLVVDTPPSLQLRRAVARDGVTEGHIHSILQAQTKREDRLRHADDILLNDRDLAHLKREVEKLHDFYLTLRGGQP